MELSGNFGLGESPVLLDTETSSVVRPYNGQNSLESMYPYLQWEITVNTGSVFLRVAWLVDD